MKGSNLGELEELMLLVIANLDQDAYGVKIRDYIRDNCGRSVSISTVHSTIHRLEHKGFLRSKYDHQDNSMRGGRPKLIFDITNSGRIAMEQVRTLRNSLWNTIPNLSFD